MSPRKHLVCVTVALATDMNTVLLTLLTLQSFGGDIRLNLVDEGDDSLNSLSKIGDGMPIAGEAQA